MGGRSGLRSASASDPGALLRLARPANGLMAAARRRRRRGAGRKAARAPARGARSPGGVRRRRGRERAQRRRDRRADAINRPARPVASGALGARAALAVAVGSYAAALACGFAVSRQAGALAAAWVVLTALYSVALKGAPVASNALVALVAASPLVMGGLSQGRVGPTVAPLALAFLAHLAREIVKDVEDVEGDAAAGVRTIAVALGPRAALAVARVVVVSLIGAAAVPFAAGLFGWGYAAGIVVVDVLLLLVLASTARPDDRAGLRRASDLLKWAMVAGASGVRARRAVAPERSRFRHERSRRHPPRRSPGPHRVPAGVELRTPRPGRAPPGAKTPGVTFEVIVHLATALAVILFFRRRIVAILAALARWPFAGRGGAAGRPDGEAADARLGLNLALGTVPAAVVGYLFESRIERAFDDPTLVSALLIVTGCILWTTRFVRREGRPVETWKDALLIGVGQAVAVLPGISRSGTTIATGVVVGLERKRAAEFAFLLSVPIILGASVVSLSDAARGGRPRSALRRRRERSRRSPARSPRSLFS